MKRIPAVFVLIFFAVIAASFASFHIRLENCKKTTTGTTCYLHAYLDFRWLVPSAQAQEIKVSCKGNAIAPGSGMTLPDKDGVTWVMNLGCQDSVCTASATRQNFGDILSFSGAITGVPGGEQKQDQIMSVNGKWKTFSMKATWDNQGCMVIP